MTKPQLARILAPATIEQWKIDTPEYKHDGKCDDLYKMYLRWTKPELVNQFNYLKSRGFING
jgi:hypothetical protein